jgi:prepilin signal peptidase PulO-like enzyme (type II secretory pathway)
MDLAWIIFLFIIGACVGSFLNVVIWRLPRGESIVFPGSHCPSCGKAIRWYDNIPLVSWLALRARCRFCKAPIAGRYIIVEGATAVRVAGLFVCYYVLSLREGAGRFDASWPMFAAHAALLCGLLVCSVVDIDDWIVPLEVCWFVSLVGVVAPAVFPDAYDQAPRMPWITLVSPETGAMAVAALVGLVISLVLVRRGLLTPSFIDAQDKPTTVRSSEFEVRSSKREEAEPKHDGRKTKAKDKKAKDRKRAPNSELRTPNSELASPNSELRTPNFLKWLLWPLRVIWGVVSSLAFGCVLTADSKITAAAFTETHGVNPRKEVLREVLFLLPPAVLAAVAYLLVTHVSAIGNAWGYLTDGHRSGALAPHVNMFLGAVYGYLIGGLVVWGTRIFGTLAFNKEAMGLGDAHLMAAVGAVTGWIVPTVAFFVAPFFALLWAAYLGITRRQRELPYGPWLALASIIVMIFYDRFSEMWNFLTVVPSR